ncbi:MAG: hypothetical protein CMF43_03155 [Legionellales bacterium]|nr:hypothetical protein [Legionellales bacterium]|tara:strand:- start:5293 stop:6504 length:1212 start_codon:yes stop_codon:yes gene_type:complete
MNKLFRLTASSQTELTKKLTNSLSEPDRSPELISAAYQTSFLYQDRADRNEKTERYISQSTGIKSAKKNICYLFTGQGSQYPGMGRTLYETLPQIKRLFDEYTNYLSSLNGKDYLTGLIEDHEQIHQTEFTQPSIVMLQLALTNIWNESHVKADYYIGHSVGEFSACAANRVYDEKTTLKIIAKRAQLMQSTPVDGAMIAIAASESTILTLMQSSQIDLDFAAFNAPKQTVLSGSKCEIDRMKSICSNANIRAKVLTVSHPFHSRLMTPMLDSFHNYCQAISHQDSKQQKDSGTIIGNVSGEKLTVPQTADYWCNHIVQPVKFSQSIQTAYEAGCRVFLEIGPDAVLAQLTKKILADKDDIVIVSSMKRSKCVKETMIDCALAMDNAGVPINWEILSTLLNTS